VNPEDIQEAIAEVRNLPTLPSVLGKILSTAANPEASAMDLGKHIAGDQSLSATILKVVNSAYYGFYRQITSVTQAIVMLGFMEVRNLALTATAFKTLNASNSDFNRQQLWHHALATAIVGERCTKLLGMRTSGSFEAGLLHDIGKVVLDLIYPDEFQEAAHAAHERECLIFEIEREMFGLDHAEVGAILGEHWNLPPSVVEAIRFHHFPESVAVNPELTQTVAVANFITYGSGLGERSNGRSPTRPATAFELLGITEEIEQKLVAEAEQAKVRVHSFLGVLSG
jgi:putative nucleotidyltransferase with HDIG domain